MRGVSAAYTRHHGANRATLIRTRHRRYAAGAVRPRRTAGGALALSGGLGGRLGAATQRGLDRAARKRQDGAAELAQGCLRRRPSGRGTLAHAPRHPRSRRVVPRTAATTGVGEAAAAKGPQRFRWPSRAPPLQRASRALPAKAAGGVAGRGPHVGSRRRRRLAQRQSAGAGRSAFPAGVRRHPRLADAFQRDGRLVLGPLGRRIAWRGPPKPTPRPAQRW